MVHRGVLKGVRLARTAPPITDSLYADDLLLFGEASVVEAQDIMTILEDFSAVFGQRIGPQKSFVWFSNATSDQTK